MIREETKRPDHNDYGMFALVIMTHGTKTVLYGKDGTQIERSDVYDLMSAYNFPSMANKPKWIILQACSGGESYLYNMCPWCVIGLIVCVNGVCLVQ